MMVPPAMIFINFGNAFCLFFQRSEIAAVHKFMDIRRPGCAAGSSIGTNQNLPGASQAGAAQVAARLESAGRAQCE
jgi:hypothetical protein